LPGTLAGHAEHNARGVGDSKFFVWCFVFMGRRRCLGGGGGNYFGTPDRRTAMAASVRYLAPTKPADLAELRHLIELPALRRLADRGLSDQELAMVRKLARATVRSARDGDVPGYLRADRVFHLYLLDLTDDPDLSEVARLLLAPGRVRAPHGDPSGDPNGNPHGDLHGDPRGEEPGHLMAREASEHCELVDMLVNDRMTAADDLLRLHLARRPA
jgi:DNA-binding GntR family transcriptional regulator